MANIGNPKREFEVVPMPETAPAEPAQPTIPNPTPTPLEVPADPKKEPVPV